MKSELRYVKELKNLPPNAKVRVYYGSEEDQGKIMKPTRKRNKYTLNQIGDALFEFIKTTNERFDRIETHLNRVEKRLDYNNLKKLPNNK